MKSLKIIVLTFLLFNTQSFADPFSWQGEDSSVYEGGLVDIKDAKKIKYKIGCHYGGFGHFRSAIELYWNDSKKREHRQIIFDEMIDWKVKSIESNQSNSEIRVEFNNPSSPEPEDIFQPARVYRFDRDKQKFEEIISD